MPDRRAGQLAQLGRRRTSPRLPAPASSTRLAATSGDVVQQRQFQRLAGDLAGVEQIAGAEARFLLAFENRHDQRVGFNLFQQVCVRA